MTEGEAVKAEITGAVGFAAAGVLLLDPLTLQEDRTNITRASIIGRKKP